MKTLNIFFLLATISVSMARGQQVFSSASFGNIHGREMISFTVPREVNVFQYRVEATNDSVGFEIIGTILPTVNSVLAKSYHYEVYQPLYTWYRIGQVGMDSKLYYTPWMAAKKQPEKTKPIPDMENAAREPAIEISQK